ncbi:MAG TPA: ABC transporter ATP-binding protein [Terriglobales bacterium]|nr:ABC transporter ATP-binding protein [Terriglobales bacterium]
MADAHEEEILGKAYDARLMKRLLGYLRPYKWQTVLALGSIVLKAIADVVGPVLTMVAIDLYMAGHFGSGRLYQWTVSQLSRHLNPDPLVGIAEIGGIYIGLLLFSFLLDFLQTYYMQWVGQMAMFDLRSEIFRHLQEMHVGFYDRNPVGRLVTRVTSDVDALNEMFTAGVVSIFEDIFVLAGIIGLMLGINWWLALITFAVLPLIFFSTLVFRKFVRDSYRRIRTAIARINAYLQEHVSGIVVLQLFNREEKSFEEFEKVNRLHMDAFKDAIMAHAVYYPVVEIFAAVAIASVIWFGGNGVMRGAVTIGVLVAFMQYAQRFFRPIQDLSEKYNILQAAMASSERIFKLLDTPAAIASPERPQVPDGPGRIEFEHVWFAYGTLKEKDEPDWVLRDVSFAIEPGETVAIVGHTGAGKTTIISLLLRFYDVQQGAVKIDGVDVRELDLTELRRRYGVVLQDPFLFTGTVEQNIRLGSKWVTDEQVERAAEEVNIADFIRTLPAGFKEPVQERGSTLSTGQKQLISFARALAHNPKILVLDEATSSVDTETEFRVRDALSRMVEGRTSVIVAHRLSTIQRADKIIVMHKGKVREIGSHQELLAQRGIYWKLYQLQYKDQELPPGAPPPGTAPDVSVSADD